MWRQVQRISRPPTWHAFECTASGKKRNGMQHATDHNRRQIKLEENDSILNWSQDDAARQVNQQRE